MEVDEVEDYARRRYNAVNDTRFFTSQELQSYMWDAQMQLAREALCIRGVYSTVSVSGQMEYPLPTRTIAVKRVSYNGQKVEPRSLDEILALVGTTVAPSGTPYCYAIWNEILYLSPTPAEDDLTIKVFSFNEPTDVSSAGELEVPTRYHLDIAEYVIWQMCIKDKNYQGANYHERRWADRIAKAKAFERKMLRADQQSFMRDDSGAIDSWTSVR